MREVELCPRSPKTLAGGSRGTPAVLRVPRAKVQPQGRPRAESSAAAPALGTPSTEPVPAETPRYAAPQENSPQQARVTAFILNSTQDLRKAGQSASNSHLITSAEGSGTAALQQLPQPAEKSKEVLCNLPALALRVHPHMHR